VRSLFTLDLTAVRANVRRLRRAVAPAALWAVVKADAYGHGARDVARAALDAGADVLCVASVAEGVALRAAVREGRILVLGPSGEEEWGMAREARLELVVSRPGRVPDGIPLHLKLDTGMGRWGLSELSAPGSSVVGLMSHFACADSDPGFTRIQLRRFLDATSGHTQLTRHVANSAAVLSLPETHLDAVRCGIAVYGISPFGDGPEAHGLVPALRWESEVAQTRLLAPGEGTGYGRTFVAERPTWVGIVPVGYADGFRRDMSGAEVMVAGERRRVVGTVSMDALAVELPSELPVGSPVTLLGDGILAEEHARVAGTIAYEIVCGLNTREPRAQRTVIG